MTPVTDETKWSFIGKDQDVIWDANIGWYVIETKGETISRAINQLHNDGGLIEAFRRNP